MFQSNKVDNNSDMNLSFSKIIASHRKNHSTQIDDICQYLVNREINKKEIDKIKIFLAGFERIFWCIDDTIDNQYSSAKMIAANEIVKFVSFIRLFEQVLTYQLNKFSDFFSLLRGRELLSQRMLQTINSHLQNLVNIPYKEKKIEREIYHASDLDQLKNLLVANQLNRAQNLNIYLGITEVFFNIKIDFAPFKQYRALQLILEDINDKEADRLNGNNNCINVLKTKNISQQLITILLDQIFQELIAKIENSTVHYSQFLLTKSKTCYEKLKLLSPLKI